MSLLAPRCSYPQPVSRDRRNRPSVQLGSDDRPRLVAVLRLVQAKTAS